MPKLTTETAPESKAEAKQYAYPQFEMKLCEGPDALTCDQMKAILLWESEAEFQARRAKETGLDAKAAKQIELPTFLFRDEHEGKVQCWRNVNNRPFDLTHARKISQIVLHRQWAGPTTMPGETVNGEPIIVSRNANVLSGQHRGVGFVLACLEWRRDPDKWRHLWPTEPVLETVIAFGVSDASKVVGTLDNTKARTEADTFYTGNAVMRVFGADGPAMEPKKRAEVCRMLQAAIDFFWRRIGMDDQMYQTHPAVQKLLDDHPRLYKAVKHIFEENAGRALSILRLSPGGCAAAMYLMSASKTNPAKHRATEEPTETMLDLGLWDKAAEFWVKLAKREGVLFTAIADVLAKLAGADEETSGSANEKFCVIAKAWDLFLANGKADKAKLAEQLKPETASDDKGMIHLVNPATFSGVDRGPKVKAPDADEGEAIPVTPEAKAAARRASAEKAASAIKALRTSGPTTKLPGQPMKPAPVAHDKNGKPPAPAMVKKPAPAAKK